MRKNLLVALLLRPTLIMKIESGPILKKRKVIEPITDAYIKLKAQTGHHILGWLMRKPTICKSQNKDAVCVGPVQKPQCWFSHETALLFACLDVEHPTNS